MARSPQLPDGAKTWFSIIIGLLLIALFIGSFFSGKRAAQPKENSTVHEQRDIHQYEAQPEPEETARNKPPITEKAASDAQAVIADFLKAFVPFDSEQPDAYLERSKPYITDSFYKQLTSFQRRGTLARVKTEYVTAEWTPAELNADEQWYNVDITVTHTDINGNKEDGLLLYVVLLKQVDGKWKVDDVGIRPGSGAIPE